MRIVAVADTHTFEDDLGALPAGDLFVHAGDLCRRGAIDELHAPAQWIAALPHAHKLVVAGNHDWCFARQREQACALLGPGVHYLQDQGLTIDGVTFWGSPWQPEFCGWAFNLPRGAALVEKWALIPDGVHVLITHGPPHGIGDRVAGPGHEGCEDLHAATTRARPLLHLFGHIHEDGGAWRDGGTLYANVTTWESERPATVIDIDPLARAVVEVQVPPRVCR